jgi:hypothetical protein
MGIFCLDMSLTRHWSLLPEVAMVCILIENTVEILTEVLER